MSEKDRKVELKPEREQEIRDVTNRMLATTCGQFDGCKCVACAFRDLLAEIDRLREEKRCALQRIEGIDYRNGHFRDNTVPDELREILRGMAESHAALELRNQELEQELANQESLREAYCETLRATTEDKYEQLHRCLGVYQGRAHSAEAKLRTATEMPAKLLKVFEADSAPDFDEAIAIKTEIQSVLDDLRKE